ncbi:MAG: hypothetical protein RMI34_05895 [Chloroherpetonaceae bacterium]|nr:hypothetical protein [Chloroherpetonaceae bacterium]MCS7212163.1 hypothetical protein [Chloroherpetonaceae bacterium]MDW8019592.1 hypothetical protein [Chloroherpetonaceae bacterium]MDW8466633.1 hypothetical protein [Chloroherpetonaceae bacterium]
MSASIRCGYLATFDLLAMQLALLVTGIFIIVGALLAWPVINQWQRHSTIAPAEEGGLQAGAIFWAVAVMFGLGVIFLALVI